MEPLLRKPATRLRRAGAVVAIIAGLGIAGTAGWAGFLRLSGNVHEIDPGIAYRSAQLSAGQLGTLLREKRLRAVINLRGPSPGAKWYDAELETTRRAGAEHFDLQLSANSEPSDTLVARLRYLLRVVPRPFVLHCEGGADRSGLASALYDLDIRGFPPAKADRELSFRFGHFPWLTSKTGAMDRAFRRVVARRDSVATPSLNQP